MPDPMIVKAQIQQESSFEIFMMAAGAFNSGEDAVLGCGKYNPRAQIYGTAIASHYHQFARATGWPDPY